MILYIDPGTGSMLFTVLLGVITTLYFFAQKLVLKLKIWLSGGRSGKVDLNEMSYVIFTDDKRYWQNFKPICDVFEEKETEIHYWTCSAEDPALSADYKYVKAEYIGNINAASVRLNRMRAGICISSTPGLGVYQWKKSKNCKWYVHMPHGVYDLRTYRMFGLDEYDAVLLSGHHQEEEIRDLEKLRNEEPKELVPAGDTHVDGLLKAKKERGIKEHEGRTVLLAPSWGKTAILARYGEKILDALIATGYKIVVRPHPQSMTSEKEMMDRLMEKYPESENFSWNFDNDNYDALSGADIMISDFSGVIWDYMFVFDRPVMYADMELDNAVYDISWTEDERWDTAMMKKVGVQLKEEDLDRIKEVIDEALSSDEMAAERSKLKEEAWLHQGESAEVIAEYMMKKYEEFCLAEEAEKGEGAAA